LQPAQFERAGIRLGYRYRRGRDGGPALVLLHGLASNSTRWTEFVNNTRLDPDWHIVCPDLRGHGASLWRGRLDMDLWLADLRALLDYLAIEQAVVVGHCLGANMALAFARRWPARCRGLVLIEPMPAPALRGALALVRPLRGLLPLLAGVVRGLNTLGIYRRRLPTLDLAELDRRTRAAMSEHGARQAVIKRYSAPSLDTFYMPIAAYLQALAQLFRPLPLNEVHAPALVLLSAGALLADPHKTRQIMAALPNVQIEMLEALHWIPTEQPERMTQLIDAWLQQLE